MHLLGGEGQGEELRTVSEVLGELCHYYLLNSVVRKYTFDEVLEM